MSSRIFKSWKGGGRQTLRWIEFDDYARHVFAGDPADWLTNPVGFVSGISQALGVVSTDVISIDLFAPFRAAVDPGSQDDPIALANALLDKNAPLAFIGDVINALRHRYAGSADLVLKVPVPHDLLLACGAPESDAQDFDHLDDVAMSLCNFLRRYAEKDIDGILLTSEGVAGVSEDEIDAYGPMFAVARHYDWFTAMAMATSSVGELPAFDCDIFLFPELSLTALGAAETQSVGGGLSKDFWLSREELHAVAGPFAYYGAIPVEAEPERVIQRIKALGSI